MTTYATSLIPHIRAILAASDLSQISAKGVRKELAARGYDADIIKQNRASIDAEIETIYEELTSADNNAPVPAESSRAYITTTTTDAPPAQDAPVKVEAKPVIKSEIVHPAPAGETDEELAARLQREFDAEISRGRASRSGGATRKKPAKKRKSKATVGSDDDGGAPKKRRGGGGGAFNKELVLSDALSALLGETRLSRPQTVKRIWEYVKSNDLQDPADKRYILCDPAMKAVFHTDKLHMFTMNKILVDHVRDPDEIANGGDDRKPVKSELKSEEMVDSDDESDAY